MDALRLTHRYHFLLVIAVSLFLFSYGHASEKQQIIYSSSTWIPFSYQDGEGQPKGLYLDIVKEIFEKHLDMEVVFEDVPWKRAQYYVAEGQADFLITVPTKERLLYTAASELPILQLFLHVYTYKNHPQLEQIKNISSGKDIKDLGLTPVSNIGNSWHSKNIDSFGVSTQYVENEESAFNVLAMKRADLTIEPIYAGSYLINKLSLSDRIEPTEAKFGPLDFHILVSKKSAHFHLMGQINDIIKQLVENGRLEEIISGYKKIQTVSP
jgi:polar amino acid transport system substrate-binding protein